MKHKDSPKSVVLSHEGRKMLIKWADGIAGGSGEAATKLKAARKTHGGEKLDRKARRAGLLSNAGNQVSVTEASLKEIAKVLAPALSDLELTASVGDIFSSILALARTTHRGAGVGFSSGRAPEIVTGALRPPAVKDFHAPNQFNALLSEVRDQLRSKKMLTVVLSGESGVGKTSWCLEMARKLGDVLGECYYLDMSSNPCQAPAENIAREIQSAELVRRQSGTLETDACVIIDNVDAELATQLVAEGLRYFDTSKKLLLLLAGSVIDLAGSNVIKHRLAPLDNVLAARMATEMLSEVVKESGTQVRDIVDKIVNAAAGHPRLLGALCCEVNRQGRLSNETPLDWLEEIGRNKSERDKMGLLISRWPDSLKVPMQQLAQFSKPFTKRLASELVTDNWDKVSPWLIQVGQEGRGSYKLYDLDRSILDGLTPPDERSQYQEKMAKVCKLRASEVSAAYATFGRQSEAYEQFALLVPHLETIRDWATEVATMTDIIKDVYGLIWERTSISDKCVWGEYAVEHASGDSLLGFIGHHLKGSSMACQGRADEAMRQYEDASDCLEKTRFEETTLDARKQIEYRLRLDADMAWRFNDLRDYEAALEKFQKNLASWTDATSQNPELEGQLWQCILASYDGLGSAWMNIPLPDFIRAEESFKAGLELIRRHAGSVPYHYTAILHRGLGEARARQSKFDDAIGDLNECMRLAKRLSWEPSLALASHDLGRTYVMKAAYFSNLLFAGDSVGEGSDHKVTQVLENLAVAEKYLREALRLAKAWRWTLLTVEVYEDLYTVAAETAKLWANRRKQLASTLAAGGIHNGVERYLQMIQHQPRDEPRWRTRPDGADLQ